MGEYEISGWEDGRSHKISIKVESKDTDCTQMVLFLDKVEIGSKKDKTTNINKEDKENIIEKIKNIANKDKPHLFCTKPRYDCLMEELQRIADRLDDRYYTINSYLDKSIIGDGIVKFGNFIHDLTWGLLVSHRRGIQCETWVKKTKNSVKELVEDVYGDEVTLEIMFLEEKSELCGEEAWWQRVDPNHTLFRITLKDGTQKYIDFWEHGRGNPLVGNWKEKEDSWKNMIGKDNFFVSTEQMLIKGETVKKDYYSCD